jgi:transcriptional regulator with XRE-family HTH domain
VPEATGQESDSAFAKTKYLGGALPLPWNIRIADEDLNQMHSDHRREMKAQLHEGQEMATKIRSEPYRPRSEGNLLAELMRAARHHSGMSQLEFSLRIGVSQRHIAFVEGGKSRPSRELLISWMSQANAPPWLRNAASHQAGFVPYLRAHDNVNAAGFQDAEDVLRLQEPNPAIIFNPDWRIVKMNETARWLCGIVMPGMVNSDELEPVPLDMIAAVQHENGLLSRMVDPEAYSTGMLAQLLAEAAVSSHLVERVAAFARHHIARFGELDANARDPGRSVMAPSFDTKFGRLSFLTVQGAFGLPQDITPTSRRFEIWHPCDTHTRDVLQHKPA